MKKEKKNLKNSQYKIVFFGTPGFVSPILDKLKDNFEVVKSFRSPREINDPIVQELKALKPDFFVVASFGRILPKQILNIPKIASINIHPSLLPRYRGPSPIQTAILNGDKKTGVSIIKMDEEVDHGPILERFEESIKPSDTFESLANRLFEKCTNALVRVITNYDEIKAKPQDESKATYTKLLTRDDGYLDLSKLNSMKIENLKLKIRAYYPWPGVWTRSEIINHESLIIKFLPKKKLQVEGKKPMSYKDFMNGYEKGKILLQKLNLEV